MGARVGCFPTPRGLPRYSGGSASTSSLSRPTQASHTLWPAGSLSRPRRPLSRGFGPAGYPTKPLVSYRTLPTTLRMASSSTGVPRRRGAPNNKRLYGSEIVQHFCWCPFADFPCDLPVSNVNNLFFIAIYRGICHPAGRRESYTLATRKDDADYVKWFRRSKHPLV
jgi:hypothetical protein